MVGSLGFEPRTANAPGWYPKPSAEEPTQDAQGLHIQLEQFSKARRRPHEDVRYQAEIDKAVAESTKCSLFHEVQFFPSNTRSASGVALLFQSSEFVALTIAMLYSAATQRGPFWFGVEPEIIMLEVSAINCLDEFN